MECGRCHASNRDGARFCISCGEALAARCTDCGAELPAEAKFCDSCGTRVGAEAAEPAATRKTVTVLFSDLTGSTSLGERMDPESVRALMTPIYAAMRREVEIRGGLVSKFVGDGLMAVFGVPEVREDDALRALDTALGMQQALDRLAADVAREHGAVISLKVGINTGEVVIGMGDEDIVGDPVNVASRLEGAAAPGEILVGEETWRLTRASATYESVAPLTLKGKSERVAAHRLVSLERTTEAASMTFVGRDAELRRLLDAFDAAVEARASRLVSIIGSPGLGKTRLTRELGASLAERALVVETRCDAGGMATLGPVAEALRTAAGIDESDDQDKIFAAIADLISEDDEDRDRVASLAAAVLGVGEPGSTEETFWAIRRIVESAARVQPMVLVLDDLHWGEPLLLDLVEHLAEWNRTAPVLLVVTGRPELREIRPSLVEGGRPLAVIPLEGLDDGATEALACGLLGTDAVPRELLMRLPASTEGNPLFVREFVRMLVDDGVLRRSNGAWVATIDVEAIEVPPTIQSLLAARVERLNVQERTVLELASVIGKEFYKGALAALAPAAVQVSLDAHLESLRRKELVEPTGTYWIDEPVLRFHHALIRDAAYRRLLKEARAELHERTAEWLEAKTQGLLGEHEELIGYHLEQAHESKRQLGVLDDHGRELGERAAQLLWSAARAALDRDDLPAASALAGRALERLEPGHERRAEVLVTRCEASLGTGDVGAAQPAIQELERIAADDGMRAWATCFEADLVNLIDPSRLHEMEQRISEAADKLAALDDAAGAAKAYTVLATTLGSLGRVTECEVALDAALTAAREAGDRRRITDVLGRAMTAALWGPSPVSRAGGRCLDLVRLSRITTNPPEVEATSLRCQAVLESFRGRADAARRMLRSARRSLEELGRPHGILQNELFAGIVELTDDQAAAAAEHFRAAYEGLRAMGVRAHAGRAAALLARAHLLMGDDGEALSLTEESERLAGADLKAAIAWRAVRAEILARRGNHDEARALAQSAVDLASKTDALIDHGDACMALVAVCRAAGDEAAARQAAERAASLYERKGATALLDSSRAPVSEVSESRPAVVGLENACTRLSAELVERFQNGEPASDLVVDGLVTDDRRRGIRATTSGAQGNRSVGVRRIEGKVIATRGERLALFEVGFLGADDSPGAFRTDLLMIQELDADGRLAHRISFDLDDLEAAIGELDERFLIGEAAPFADTYRVALDYARARNSDDWDTFRDFVADDFVLIDHRGTSFGEARGVDAAESISHEMATLAPGTRVSIASVDGIRDGAIASRVLYRGTTGHGAQFEIGYSSVLWVEDGRMVRQERFPLDRLDLALTRFEELQPGAEPALDNDCLRALRRCAELFEGRDWDALRTIFTAGALVDDRRAVIGLDSVGRDAVMEMLRGMAEIGTTRWQVEPIATRGERLALARHTVSGPDVGTTAFGAELLMVTELDREGPVRRAVAFDSGELESAVAELDDSYLADEGAGVVDLLGALKRLDRAVNEKDRQSFRDLMATDCVFRDHRLVALREIRGADGLWQYVSELFPLIPGFVRYTSRIPAIREDAVVEEVRYIGSPQDGSDVEISFLAVRTIHNGRIDLIEHFPVEAAGRALARFEELGEHHLRAPLDNRCVRVLREYIARMGTGTRDELAAFFTEDLRGEDRRKGFGGSTVDRDSHLAQIEFMLGVIGEYHADLDVIATRGERLALTKHRLTLEQGDGSPVIEFLNVNELEAEGRIATGIVFDVDDFDAAIDELNERYVAGEGAFFEPILRVGLGMIDALNARDWASVRECIADDFVLVDHQQVSLGEVQGRDAFIAAPRELYELVPDMTQFVPVIGRIQHDAVLCLVVSRSRQSDFEVSFWCVMCFADGLFTRQERFPVEAFDTALARYEELGNKTRSLPLAMNASGRQSSAFAEHFNAGDWDWIEASYADDVVFEDRRAGLGARLVGKDPMMQQLRVMSEVGTVGQRPPELVATRGERLSLMRVMWIAADDGGDFEVDGLMILELDEQDRASSVVVFDGEQLEAAIEELDERFLSGEGSSYPELGRMAASRDARNLRDWSTLRSGLSDDFLFVDHRPIGLGTLGPDEWVDSLGVIVDLSPDLRWDILTFPALAEDRFLLQERLRGQTSDGSDVEIAVLALDRVRNGKWVYRELFPVDELDAALARFEELGTDPHGALENAASRTTRKGIAWVVGRDWDALAELMCEDAEQDDRRAGVGNVLRGRAELMGNFRAIGEIGVDRMEYTVLATRGERLVLGREVVGAADPNVPYESEFLSLHEYAEDGRLKRQVFFDPSQLGEAFAELDERFLAGEGAPFAHIGRQILELPRFSSAGDWGALRALFTTDAVIIDRTPASRGEMTLEGYIESLRALTSLFETYRIDVTVLDELSASVSRGRAGVSGTSAEGGVVEIVYEFVGGHAGGAITRLELFSPEQVELARVRFEELVRAEHGPRKLDNESIRVLRRLDSLFSEQRWDEITALLTEDSVYDDGPRGMGWRIEGREERMEQFRLGAELGGERIVHEPIAIRGDRLSLTRGFYRDRNDFEDASLAVTEIDETGRVSASVLFKPDDLDAAFAELDARYLAGEGSEHAHWITAGFEFLSAYNARDWSRFRATVADDVTIEDHRPTSLGRVVGADAVADAYRTMTDLIPDAQWRISEILALVPNIALVSSMVSGTGPGGGAVDLPTLGLARFRDGLVAAIEIFPVERHSDALARFEELTAPRVGPLANSASLATDRVTEGVRIGDWDAVADAFGDDAVTDDHRAGLRATWQGRRAQVENLRWGGGVAVSTCLATRGDRLALTQMRFGARDDFQVEILTVTEVDAEGRLKRMALFDPDNLDAAFTELDERYLAAEGAPYADVWRNIVDSIRDHEKRDMEGFAASMPAEFVYVDHRPASLGRIERSEELVRLQEALIELMPDARVRVVQIHAINERGAMWEEQISGTNSEGGHVEMGCYAVVAGTTPPRLENFPLDQRETALARFEELTRESSP